jgi:gliding motility-associated lipoprotein GldB
MRIRFLIFLIIVVTSCSNESSIEKKISEIDMDFDVERFDQLYAKVTSENFSTLRETYPFLFSKRFSDSLWLAKLKDTLQQELHKEVEENFKDFSLEENEIEKLFQHLKYYDKTFKEPRVITVTNNVDYRNKIIVTDTIVLVALDNYLGKDHQFYGGIQSYLRQNFKPEQIVVNMAAAYGEKQIFNSENKTLLADMITAGKELFFKDIMIPFKTDAQKIGYSDEQLAWAHENEKNIWGYFVENELLYKTDPKLASRFINPAPFSKFGLDFDNESPGRLGQYIGWQIVRAFMENNEIDYQQMLSKTSDEIFRNSKYKPQK